MLLRFTYLSIFLQIIQILIVSSTAVNTTTSAITNRDKIYSEGGVIIIENKIFLFINGSIICFHRQ